MFGGKIQLHNVNKLHKNLRIDGIQASSDLLGCFEDTGIQSSVVNFRGIVIVYWAAYHLELGRKLFGILK